MKVLAPFGRPAFMKAIWGWAIWVSIAEWVLATAFGWVDSVRYVSHLSQLSISLAAFVTWMAARVEQRQDEEITEAHK